MKAYIVTAFLFIPFAAEAGEVTAKTTLRKGTLLTDNLIMSSNEAKETRTEIEQNFIGRELSRTVYAGHVIDISYMRAPTLIKRNAHIDMVYSYGALRLTAKGKALQTGSEGDLISVMNLSSRKKISATVTGVDTVEVR